MSAPHSFSLQSLAHVTRTKVRGGLRRVSTTDGVDCRRLLANDKVTVVDAAVAVFPLDFSHLGSRIDVGLSYARSICKALEVVDLSLLCNLVHADAAWAMVSQPPLAPTADVN